MQSWQIPPVPRLPTAGHAIRVFDTASQGVVTAGPESGTARMYVCGITPYDATHMGHAATYLTFDIINRAWRDQGLTVSYVQNITDIDDPLLERANATGVAWEDLALREVALFREDMTALNVIPPDHYIGAVESIPLVVKWIDALSRNGAVYPVNDDLYFDVHSDSSFGSVAHMSVDEMVETFAQRGGDPQLEGKRHALDPLLWLQQRPGEPGWQSPFGTGRPGWHIECVAIALEHLGMTFDVQGGGSDLAFPHHEMGASQAQVATGLHPYARAYVHAGMVGLDGQKMSKSQGNLVFVSRLRDNGVDPMAIRLALLSDHYRQNRDWTDKGLSRAQERLTYWRSVLEEAVGDPSPMVAGIRRCIADDLDTPGALEVVDSWMVEARRSENASWEHTSLALTAIDALLGVRL